MAIKGAIAKQEVANKILEIFGDKAFVYDKDIRINCIENGETVQIKVALTAAKVAVEKDGDNAMPAATVAPKAEMVDFENMAPAPAPIVEPTADEKKNIADLLAQLGL